MRPFPALQPAATLAKSLLTRVPMVSRRPLIKPLPPASARYSYGVWLKHLTLLWHNGMQQMPRRVIELGPGSSLGAGFAALLSGIERYAGIDVARCADADCASETLAQMTWLFQQRAPRPGKGWPDYDRWLDARLFPGDILTEDRLGASLEPARLEQIGEAAAKLDPARADSPLQYLTWQDAPPFAGERAELVFSHVVLNEIEDLDGIYARCSDLVAPGGWMSHQIDFSSLGITTQWNGHLAYEERLWKLLSGRRACFVNRARCSAHLALMHRHGFEILFVARERRTDGLDRRSLARRWRGLSEDDLDCCAAFVVARRR